jgi:hypothetical protein
LSNVEGGRSRYGRFIADAMIAALLRPATLSPAPRQG